MISFEDLGTINKLAAQYSAAYTTYLDFTRASGVTLRFKTYGTYFDILNINNEIEDNGYIRRVITLTKLDTITEDSSHIHTDMTRACREACSRILARELVVLHDALLGHGVKADPALPEELLGVCVCPETPKEAPPKEEPPKGFLQRSRVSEAQYKFLQRVQTRGGVYDILGETNKKIAKAARLTCEALTTKGYLEASEETEGVWELTDAAVKFLEG